SSRTIPVPSVPCNNIRLVPDIFIHDEKETKANLIRSSGCSALVDQHGGGCVAYTEGWCPIPSRQAHIWSGCRHSLFRYRRHCCMASVECSQSRQDQRDSPESSGNELARVFRISGACTSAEWI